MKFLIAISLFASLTLSAFAQFDPNCFGSRKAMVHLFEWRWADIADECERFLSKNGFCGVQVSPPNEHRVVWADKEKRPWWERYQPVSYKMYTRSGDEQAFINMVQRCNDVGVRIYVDAVLNHMAGEDAGQGTGTGGSSFNSKTLNFQGVPYGPNDFNAKGKECKSGSGGIDSYQDPNQVRNCRLSGLVDLKQSSSYVRGKIVEWLNKMVGWGVAGFRFDAAKHMWPDDLRAMIGSLNTLPTKWFQSGAKPFIFQEVIDIEGREPIKNSEYYGFGRVTEFNYGKYLSEAFRGSNQLKNLRTFGQGWGYLMPSDKALVFIDNHDNQRGHGAGGNILNFFSPRQYKMAVTYMLSWPYGVARVMSSYYWDRNFQGGKDQNDWVGPPHDGNYNIKPVTINADETCGNGWMCEHRWRQITSMAGFRNVAGNDAVQNWWDDGDNQISFSRGNKAFFAMNGGSRQMSATLQTGLKSGRYCDIISGTKSEDGKSCTGKVISVGSDGKAQIQISNSAEDPMVAIHIDSILDGQPIPVDPTPETKSTATPKNTSTVSPRTPGPITGYQRTIVFLKYQSKLGDFLFLRGGVDENRRPACQSDKSQCWIPIDYSHVSYPAQHYVAYRAWSQGDKYLDWLGAESGQGSYQSKQADGSPLVWTTNKQSDAGYSEYNTFGQHFWMLDVNMDCSATEEGWFELKGLLNGNWETDISQTQCSGNAGVSTAITSHNHVARCGYKNIFEWNANSCQIDKL